MPIWSCDPDYLNTFSYQHPMELLHMELGFEQPSVLFLGKKFDNLDLTDLGQMAMKCLDLGLS